MQLWLQFGWGMMEYCRELLGHWGGGTVILSPRDLNPEQLKRFSGDLAKLEGEVAVDPQFYLPHTVHHRLTSHDYWPDDYESTEFWSQGHVDGFLDRLLELNRSLDSTYFILPGLFAKKIEDGWLTTQSRVFGAPAFEKAKDLCRLATVALDAAPLDDEDQVNNLLEAIRQWPVEGVYLSCVGPDGPYLVSSPMWLAAVLELVAGIRLMGKMVVIGNCNHQMLITASAGANAIAAGTWMNLRSFDPDKFEAKVEEEIKQRQTWYYCPQALSEYKLQFLDVAKATKVLDQMVPARGLDQTYSVDLFTARKPTDSQFNEPLAFKHYLMNLHIQAGHARADSFEATVAAHKALVGEAEALLTTLRKKGVTGALREFTDCVAAHQGALAILLETRGPLLKRNWSKLS